jgi:hypothetical protein
MVLEAVQWSAVEWSGAVRDRHVVTGGSWPRKASQSSRGAYRPRVRRYRTVDSRQSLHVECCEL